MAHTFSEKSYSAHSYDTHRPRYPDELYETILAYHQSSTNLSIDLGCGTVCVLVLVPFIFYFFG